jgi:hypothetical protein
VHDNVWTEIGELQSKIEKKNKQYAQKNICNECVHDNVWTEIGVIDRVKLLRK